MKRKQSTAPTAHDAKRRRLYKSSATESLRATLSATPLQALQFGHYLKKIGKLDAWLEHDRVQASVILPIEIQGPPVDYTTILPQEIHAHIFNYVEQKQLPFCAQVSKSWRKLAYESVTSFTLRQECHINLLPHLKNLRRLEVHSESILLILLEAKEICKKVFKTIQRLQLEVQGRLFAAISILLTEYDKFPFSIESSETLSIQRSLLSLPEKMPKFSINVSMLNFHYPNLQYVHQFNRQFHPIGDEAAPQRPEFVGMWQPQVVGGNDPLHAMLHAALDNVGQINGMEALGGEFGFAVPGVRPTVNEEAGNNEGVGEFLKSMEGMAKKQRIVVDSDVFCAFHTQLQKAKNLEISIFDKSRSLEKFVLKDKSVFQNVVRVDHSPNFNNMHLYFPNLTHLKVTKFGKFGLNKIEHLTRLRVLEIMNVDATDVQLPQTLTQLCIYGGHFSSPFIRHPPDVAQFERTMKKQEKKILEFTRETLPRASNLKTLKCLCVPGIIKAISQSTSDFINLHSLAIELPNNPTIAKFTKSLKETDLVFLKDIKNLRKLSLPYTDSKLYHRTDIFSELKHLVCLRFNSYVDSLRYNNNKVHEEELTMSQLFDFLACMPKLRTFGPPHVHAMPFFVDGGQYSGATGKLNDIEVICTSMGIKLEGSNPFDRREWDDGYENFFW
mmetsp:Transcript_17673/g.19679  ORF Transcript_17673/g.19679 Transcript_17673/m.19679 type:complete len:669 (+) Transcript_17673:65-2071(+)